MDYNLYELNPPTFPCWVWREGKLERSSIAVSKNGAAIGEVLNALGYYSVCSYTKEEGYSAGIITYLYRNYGGATEDEPYLTLTLLDPRGAATSPTNAQFKREHSQPGKWQAAEIVKFADWASALEYLNHLIPVMVHAQKTDLQYG
ncbi:MAG TPA: hypothetical protein VJG32_19295 [Anaerolineae bacterium]|nr:hypothetical protein [Anaerolineae bacterium]